MEALRYKLALIVVPNPTLLDNHQAELAEECERKEWAVVGKLGSVPPHFHLTFISDSQPVFFFSVFFF